MRTEVIGRWLGPRGAGRAGRKRVGGAAIAIAVVTVVAAWSAPAATEAEQYQEPSARLFSASDSVDMVRRGSCTRGGPRAGCGDRAIQTLAAEAERREMVLAAAAPLGVAVQPRPDTIRVQIHRTDGRGYPSYSNGTDMPVDGFNAPESPGTYHIVVQAVWVLGPPSDSALYRRSISWAARIRVE